MDDLPLCGKTTTGKPILGGAFQMADTHGYPLWLCMDSAAARGVAVSIPHYFASAMEAGWDDVQTFAKIEEALAERRELDKFEPMKTLLIGMFMEVAHTMPGQPATEIGKKMREQLEKNL